MGLTGFGHGRSLLGCFSFGVFPWCLWRVGFPGCWRRARGLSSSHILEPDVLSLLPPLMALRLLQPFLCLPQGMLQTLLV